MTITRAATRAAPAAVQVPADLVNVPSGSTALERYPGPVDPGQYDQPGVVDPARGGPVTGEYGSEDFRADDGLVLGGGGGYQDTAWTQGHDGPELPWDSSAGAPFAPSGALNPELHAEDTGGVFRREHVTGPDFGRLTRRSLPGETHVNLANSQTTIAQTTDNGRLNLDQYQALDSDGFDPWGIDYSERALYANLAWQPMAVQGDGAYIPSGSLPDRSPYPQGSQAYDAPPDPEISPAPAPAAAAAGGWLLG